MTTARLFGGRMPAGVSKPGVGVAVACASGVEDAESEARGVVLGRGGSDSELLGVGDADEFPVGRLLSRPMTNKVATTASTATTPNTIHVVKR